MAECALNHVLCVGWGISRSIELRILVQVVEIAPISEDLDFMAWFGELKILAQG
jgi:hypothetical protein